MWCHYEAFTCFGIWQEPSLHTCREAKNSSSRICVSSVAWKESHCMVWGKKKHLYLNRCMCWCTELLPAWSLCACELLSSLSRWALGHQATGGVCGHWLLGIGGSAGCAWGLVMVRFWVHSGKGKLRKRVWKKASGSKEEEQLYCDC